MLSTLASSSWLEAAPPRSLSARSWCREIGTSHSTSGFGNRVFFSIFFKA